MWVLHPLHQQTKSFLLRLHVEGRTENRGFLDIFLSISGGFEIDFIPFLIYFGGVAVWANAVVENMTLRYSLIGGALLLAAVFFHYGEVLFWHKQVVFWSTVVVVMYFMFNEPKKRG